MYISDFGSKVRTVDKCHSSKFIHAKGGLISEDWSHLHKNLPNHYLQLLHFWLHVQVDHNSLIVLFLSMEPN